MMHVSVEYQDKHQEFEIAESSLVGSWHGPAGASGTELGGRIREALESPRNYPPLRQSVVPGDRVVVAWDPGISQAGVVVEALAEVLAKAGVEAGDLTFLTPAGGADPLGASRPPGSKLVVHDPDDRTQLAYLATTKQGRRVYLNRLLTDADLVVPVGRLGFDSVLGYRGPFSLLFPSLSDRETIRASREVVLDEIPDPSIDRPGTMLTEAYEVGWLLGSQFQLGLVPGWGGIVEVIAGLESTVRTEGAAAIAEHWTFRAESSAELVVAGIAGDGSNSSHDDLAQALATATRLVQHGGKIVVLSGNQWEIGPALSRLAGVDDQRAAAAALRGHEGDLDFIAARRLTHALLRADVFLSSELPRHVVEDLSMIALDHPRQAQRLVAQSSSTLFVSNADLTRAVISGESHR